MRVFGAIKKRVRRKSMWERERGEKDARAEEDIKREERQT